MLIYMMGQLLKSKLFQLIFLTVHFFFFAVMWIAYVFTMAQVGKSKKKNSWRDIHWKKRKWDFIMIPSIFCSVALFIIFSHELKRLPVLIAKRQNARFPFMYGVIDIGYNYSLRTDFIFGTWKTNNNNNNKKQTTREEKLILRVHCTNALHSRWAFININMHSNMYILMYFFQIVMLTGF